MTFSPVRGRVVAALLLLLVSAAAWLSPLALADPPLPADAASPQTIERDAEKLLFEHPKAFIALALLKYVPAAIGLALLILEWVRVRDVRRGLLPPFPPLRPATAPVSVVGAAAAVFVFLAVPTLILQVIAGMDKSAAGMIPVHVAVFAVAGIPLAIATVVLRRRLVRAGAAGPVPAGPALRGALRTFCVATLVSVGAAAIVMLVLLRFGVPQMSQQLVNQIAFSPDPLVPLSISTYGVLAAPWVEECVFRGLLQPAIRNRFGVPAGVWVSSLVFTGFHYEFAHGVSNFYALVPLFVLALFLARLRDRTDSIMATTVVHALNNATTIGPLLFLRT